MSELDEFLELNKINGEELRDALHMDIREIILNTICKKMKYDKDFFIKVKKIFFSKCDQEATKTVVFQVCHCKLSYNDIIWMSACLRAFFAKNDVRRRISINEKQEILKKQKYTCAICGKTISIDKSHVDHKIPWDYVGDKLKDNLQALCSDCNFMKSNHVAITVSNIILHMEVAK